jgi:hypothetical protein
MASNGFSRDGGELTLRPAGKEASKHLGPQAVAFPPAFWQEAGERDLPAVRRCGCGSATR